MKATSVTLHARILTTVVAECRPSSFQVELPSMRQPANATDTMSNMVLSGQSSASAHTLDRAERPKPAAVHRARPVRINCKQASKAQAAEQRLERMVMSDDLGSQVLPIHGAFPHSAK